MDYVPRLILDLMFATTNQSFEDDFFYAESLAQSLVKSQPWFWRVQYFTAAAGYCLIWNTQVFFFIS